MTQTEPTPASWVHQRAVINGLQLHYVETGHGPLLVLLHGFPEFWYSWRHQIPALAGAGFRVVALDLRGYNESAKPRGVRHYRMELLVEDVVGLIHHVGAPRAIVVGHDWGGVIAWRLASDHPQRVDRLIVLNAPHPAAFLRELCDPAQWLRSAYMLFFQLPWLPERLLSWRDYALLERTLTDQPTRPGAFTPDDIQQYKRALAQAGARTAALNYYRAALWYLGSAARTMQPITTPTLLIWGERDPYLGIRLTEGLDEWVPDLRIQRLAGASHWVQNDDPERVNQLMLEFLRGPPAGLRSPIEAPTCRPSAMPLRCDHSQCR
jgi:pimeloyl-ACP methyl ester carboxylesterase